VGSIPDIAGSVLISEKNALIRRELLKFREYYGGIWEFNTGGMNSTPQNLCMLVEEMRIGLETI